MKTIVVIMVYDRLDNVKRWNECWKQCIQNAEVVIIQNYDGSESIKDYCESENLKYIRRQNIGFDIGAFQDICRERLEGFNNDWGNLLWCADDTFPMRKDFVTPYVQNLKEGIVCTDLSQFVKTHIRTTGFAIKKETSLRLKFDVDPITTKMQCYEFEHKSNNAFYEQIKAMGLKVVEADSRETSPLWDSGYRKRLPRGTEHFKVFPKSHKIGIICPVYKTYPQIISSFICQTYKNWEMLLINDGPDDQGIRRYVDDLRIHFIETEKHAGNFGHGLRDWALKNIDELLPGCDFIVVTNGDNYHVPTYLEYMRKGFIDNPLSVAVFCSEMLHSYVKWKPIVCSLKLGFIDCAGVMVRKDIAKETGWPDIQNPYSDWTYFNNIIKKYGTERWAKVQGTLLIHN